MLLSRHSRKPSMPIALARYLEPYNAYLRPLGYYATWTVYFLSFAVSPGLVTVLQALCLVLSWILPSVELNVERGRRQILASRWIRPEWACLVGRGPCAPEGVAVVGTECGQLRRRAPDARSWLERVRSETTCAQSQAGVGCKKAAVYGRKAR